MASGSARTIVSGPVPVVVLKTSDYLSDHHATAIARTLGRIGVPVYGAIDSRRTPMNSSRYTCATFAWAAGDSPPESLLEGLVNIGRMLDRPAVLIPIDDVGAILIAEHATTLRDLFRFPAVAPDLPRRLASKHELHALCERLGVPHPRSIFPRSMTEVEQFVEQAVFPVVAKAAEAWRLPAGVTRTLIADHPEQLVAHYRSATGPQGSPNLLLQEYIPHADGEDWIFHGYCDTAADCPLRFTGRKFRSYPAFAGVTCFGRSAANPVLARLAEGLLKDIAYSGIVDLDYRLDRRDGQYKLLDFNPRAGAQFRLFESELGLDVVRALYLDLTGQAVEPSPQRDGRVFVLEPYDLVSGARYVKAGRLTLREWYSTLRGRREWAWFAWDDPLPFLAMLLRLVKRAVQRLRPRSPWRHGRLPAGSAGEPQY